MRFTRLEMGNTAAEIWDVASRRARITPAEVSAYHARYRQLHAGGEEDTAAQFVADEVRASKHVRREIRTAWLEKRLAYWGPHVVDAWRRRVVPRSIEQRHEEYVNSDRSAPGVYVVATGKPAECALAIYVLNNDGKLVASTASYGTDAHQAAAINHAVAFYRSSVARPRAA